MCVNDTNRRVNATEKDVFLQKITKRCYPHYVKEDSILYFMYSESLRSPICWGQSILIKETPTPSHQIYTNERKGCLLTQTKERWCQYQLTSLLYRTLFRLSALFSKFLKNFFQRKRQPEIHQIAFSVF